MVGPEAVGPGLHHLIVDGHRDVGLRQRAGDQPGRASAAARSPYFVAPMVRPRTMWRETSSANTVTGSTITVPVAMILPQGSS